MFSELRNILSFDLTTKRTLHRYISAHAAPDLYSSLVLYVDYIRATFTLVLLDELILVSSISLPMWGEPIGDHARIYDLGYSYEQPQHNT